MVASHSAEESTCTRPFLSYSRFDSCPGLLMRQTILEWGNNLPPGSPPGEKVRVQLFREKNKLVRNVLSLVSQHYSVPVRTSPQDFEIFSKSGTQGTIQFSFGINRGT